MVPETSVLVNDAGLRGYDGGEQAAVNNARPNTSNWYGPATANWFDAYIWRR